MANLTAYEQQLAMLELIELGARRDPNGEAKRYKISPNKGVSSGDKISSLLAGSSGGQ